MYSDGILARFESKILIDQNTDCQLWTGYVSKTGYGNFRVLGKTLRANRVAWELNIGSIPKGLVVCHRCDISYCVNPKHLFLGTQKENLQDMFAKGRDKARFFHKNKTICVNGHPYSVENTLWVAQERRCKLCAAVTRKKYYQRVGK
jgi:hypothetical protein